MAKMTLLEIVQEILSDMNSDNVNSISDTIESMQVATIVRRTFFNLYNDRIWPHMSQLLRINSSADSDKPTHMYLDDALIHMDWVKYDVRTDPTKSVSYKDILYKEPKDFIDFVMQRDSTKNNVTTVMDYNGTPLLILNDTMPTYYTSFDDEHLVFDSWDQSVDSILQQSKTQAFGLVEPTFDLSDTFVPDVPVKAFPYFVNEAKSTAFLKVKEVFSQKDEQNAGRQKSWLAREKHRVNGGIKYPNYGRKRP